MQYWVVNITYQFIHILATRQILRRPRKSGGLAALPPLVPANVAVDVMVAEWP